jgi:hypothetical protein
MASSRKREALSDATNVIKSTPKRSCAVRAVKQIAKLNVKKAPRGPQAISYVPSSDVCTLKQLLQTRPDVLDMGKTSFTSLLTGTPP